MTRKIPGIIFIILAALFSLAIVAQIPKLIGTIIGLSQSNPDAYKMGYVIGYIIGYSFFLVITILLWIYGIKWIKKKIQ